MISVEQILKRTQSGYVSKLNTDEWKEFSRRIRSQRNGACECCKQKGKETHVHHFAYNPELEPWQASDDDVALLCRECHNELHLQLQKFRRFVFRLFTPQSMRVLNGALAVGLTEYDPLTFAYAVAEMAASPGSVKRFFEAWSKQPTTPSTSGNEGLK